MSPLVLLNGEFLPADQARVSIFDRGYLYGDGLFETIRLQHGQLFRWPQHLQRLTQTASYLGLTVPFPGHTLRAFATELAARNSVNSGLLRIALSRGTGPRGYSPKGCAHPTLSMTLHPLPPEETVSPRVLRVVTSSITVPVGQPLTSHKTASKIAHVLARAEADAAGADEALLCNSAGRVAEATSSNLFWIRPGAIHTPPLTEGALAGVTRSVVFELCARLGLVAREEPSALAELFQAESLFLCSSAIGLLGVGTLDGRALGMSPLLPRLQFAYRELLESETRAGTPEPPPASRR